MIKETVIIMGMLAAAGTVSAAQVQTDTGVSADAALGQGFATLDANGNGQVGWLEAKNNIPRAAFESADSNGNGALSKSEYQTAKANGGFGATGDAGAGVQAGEDSMSGDSTTSMSDEMSDTYEPS